MCGLALYFKFYRLNSSNLNLMSQTTNNNSRCPSSKVPSMVPCIFLMFGTHLHILEISVYGSYIVAVRKRTSMITVFFNFDLTETAELDLAWKRQIKLRQNRFQEGSIPVGCVPPACQTYVLRWPLDVGTGGGEGAFLRSTSLNRSPVMSTIYH